MVGMKEEEPKGSEFQAQPPSGETKEEKAERLEKARADAQAATEKEREKKSRQVEEKAGRRERGRAKSQEAAERATQPPQSEAAAGETSARTLEEQQVYYRAKRKELEALEARGRALDSRLGSLRGSQKPDEDEIAKTEAEKASVIGEKQETIEMMERRPSLSAAERARYGVPEVVFDPNKLREQMAWFQRTIARIESQKLPFSEAWQDTSALKWYIASIDPIKYPEHLGTLRTFQQIYETRRMLHDFMYVYEKAGGTDDIIGIGHYANLENLEQLVKGDVWVETEEGKMEARDPVEAMLWFQGRADGVLEERKRAAEARTDKEEKEAKQREKDIISEMQARARGEVVEIGKDGKKIVKPDDKEGTYYRLGGRLFSAFGFAAQYNITLNGSGDFLLSRLMNMKGFLLGDDWKGREKLWKYFRQNKFVQPLFSDKNLAVKGFDDDKEKGIKGWGQEIGLMTTEEIIDEKKGISARITRIVKDEDGKAKFKQLSFRAHNVDGSVYAAHWCDQNVKADKWRSFVLSGAGYNQSPDMKTFMEMSKYLEHIKGGEKRSRFTDGLMRGLIDFYRKDEGFLFWKESAAEKLSGNKTAYWESTNIKNAIMTATPLMIDARVGKRIINDYLGPPVIRDIREAWELAGGKKTPLRLLLVLWDLIGLVLSEVTETDLKPKKKK
jgi:hypothetical protein